MMRKKILLFSAAVLLIQAVACFLYISDDYPADMDAIAAFSEHSDISEEVLQKNITAYIPDQPEAGLIFYPGGKVEHTAYEPLMLACVQQNILCVLVEMPAKLAVLDMDAAEGIRELFPDVRDWYLCGHSLGGSMAAAYLEDHADEYRGLILLAAYSTADLRGTSLEVLSVYGSEDRVLNMENYRKNKSNLPVSFTERILEGGCHAYFGMYGAQAGDGTPSITNEAQITAAADCIAEFVLSGK